MAQFSARMPLRVKLITALLALVIAALAAISVAGAFVLRDYLHSNADKQVTTLYQQEAGFISPRGISPAQPPLNEFGPFLEAFVPQGQSLGSDLSTGVPSTFPAVPTTDSSWLADHSGQLVTVRSIAGGDQWRVLTRQVEMPSTYGLVNGTLIAAEDLGNINQTIGRLTSIDLIVGAIVVLGLAIVGIAVVRASLQPLAEIEQTAGEIAAGDLSRRVAEHDPNTEVGSLGRSLNAMLAQIEAAFRAQAQSEATARTSEGRMRQFAADASHELRTPLTAIKGFAEYYRQRGGVTGNGNGQMSAEELDRIMHRVEDEATRMGGLVEDLLLLARIDQQRPLEHRPVDLLALAADAVQDARIIAPNREVGLTVGRGAAFLVMGDEARLRQVVGNLMTNALSHTPDGTAIEVHVRSGTIGGWDPANVAGVPGRSFPAVIFEVVDHGPGMMPDQAQRVFERFYRADQARTRATGGTGLGLAIVSALVSAHGGTVLLDTAPGRGATFRVTLPLAADAQGDDGYEPEEDPQGWAWPPGQAPGKTAPGQAVQPVSPGTVEPSQAPPRPDAPGVPPDVVAQQPWQPHS